MDLVLVGIRLVHIAAGAVALVAGAVALGARKGARTHRRWGRVYAWSMLVVVVSAAVLSILLNTPFLLLVAVFSGYLLASGYRSLRRKNAAQPTAVDWLVPVAGGTGSLLLGGYGVSLLAKGIGFGVVAVVFGSVGTALAVAELRALSPHRTRPMQWLFTHLARMTGSYIAVVTAFLVVSVDVLPLLVRWLLPTLVGTLAIVRWSRRYAEQFGGRG